MHRSEVEHIDKAGKDFDKAISVNPPPPKHIHDDGDDYNVMNINVLLLF